MDLKKKKKKLISREQREADITKRIMIATQPKQPKSANAILKRQSIWGR